MRLLEHLVLGLQVGLDLGGFVQDRLGVLIGVLGAVVGRCSLHVLADDDHRQQDQLEERLRNPGDEAFAAGLAAPWGGR